MERRMNNIGTVKARKVLEVCGVIDNPCELSIEDIVLSRGVTHIQAIKIDGAQGRIILDGNDAIISYDKNIASSNKKRFIIAHELGHYELHRNFINIIHTDNERSLNEWYVKGKHEWEANQFASEFLMPSHLFTKHVKDKQFDLNLIKIIAEAFKTSMTASLLKYRDLGNYPIAIIFCLDKKVQWSSFSHDFCLKYIPMGMNVPINSVANDFYRSNELPPEPEIVDAMEWFYQDYKIEEFKHIEFYEQCLRVGENGVLSCIWNN